MAGAIAAVQQAYIAHATGEAFTPKRTAVGVPDRQGTALFMPSYFPAASALGLKVVAVFPENTRLSLPAINGFIALLDPHTGVPAALMDAGYLTALRTGAGSGAATAALARPDARVLAILGAGAQAPFQALAVATVRPIDTVIVYNRTRARAEKLAEDLAATLPGSPRITVAASASWAVQRADVICTATAARTPLFAPEDVKPGTHLNAIGSFTPEMQEFPPAICTRARVYVDDVEACLAEAGELIAAVEEGYALPSAFVPVGLVLAGRAGGRQDASEITLFKSVGLAVQDMAVGAAVLAAARRLHLGQEIPLDQDV